MEKVAVVSIALAASFIYGLPAFAAGEDATAPLRRQGTFWEERQQPAKAIAAWERILDIDSSNVEAMTHLARLYASSGADSKAAAMLDRLKSVDPKSDATQSLVKEINRKAPKDFESNIAKARSLSANRDYERAIQVYREAFNGSTPDRGHALEYYQTLGATSEGWEPARSALKSLADKNPDDSKITLALAQHLTYRESSRREGISMLSSLVANNQRPEAASSWKNALVWLKARPADASLYQNYITVVGSDADIQKKLTDLSSGTKVVTQAAPREDSNTKAIFAELEAGNLTSAEERITSARQAKPQDSDLTAALGILRLKQGRFSDAEASLGLAQRQSKSGSQKWAQAYATARFWSTVEQADQLRSNQDLKGAEAAYRKAIALAPKGPVPVEVKIALANVLLDSGKHQQAIEAYRKILNENPNDPEATKGLINALYQTGRTDEALQMAADAPPAVRGQLSQLRAVALQNKAKAGMGNDLSEAQADLEDALRLDPTSSWIRLDLAKVYLASGQADKADSIMSALSDAGNLSPEQVQVHAYYLEQKGDWAGILQALETLPQESRTPSTVALQNRAWFQYQLQRVDALIKQGDTGNAAEILIDLAETSRSRSFESMGEISSRYAKLGDPGRAISMLRQAIAKSPTFSVQLNLVYASLLLDAGQDSEFEVVADRLAVAGTLSPADQASLDQLIVTYRIRLADKLRAQGKLADSYAQLRDVISRYPYDQNVQMAFARLLTASRDYDHAQSIYDAAIKSDGNSKTAQVGKAGLFLQKGETEKANEIVGKLLRKDPNDLEALNLSAQVQEAQGRRGDALKTHRKISELTGGKGGTVLVAGVPNLQYIDDRSPSTGVPDPIGIAMRNSAPSTGPLRARVTGVALPSPEGVTPQAEDLELGGMRLSTSLGASKNMQSISPNDLRQRIKLQSADEFHPLVEKADATPVVSSPAAVNDEAVARLESSTTGYFTGAATSRSRSGQAGLSSLSDFEMPLTWRSRETTAGQFGVDVTPVYLDSGAASGSNLVELGTLALVNGAADPGSQSAAGVAIKGTYRYGAFKGDLGTTPLGFTETRISGSLGFNLSPGNWRIAATALRRPVMDSLLSYAGLEDTLTGKNWGGVSRTGGRLNVGYDGDLVGVYTSVAFYTLDGRNVDTNREFDFGAGFYSRLLSDVDNKVTIGLGLTGFSYEKNLSYFTFGHGGYFSPKIYTSVAVPVEWSGYVGAMTYQVKASLGYATFRADGNSYYPAFQGLQDQLDTYAAANPGLNLETGYSAKNSSGVSYALSGIAEYRLLPKVRGGVKLSIDNARDYREGVVMGYLRFYYDEQPSPTDYVSPAAALFDDN
ncbi:MAG: cellulose synthase subunit BcsC-related outer membrane protein [Pseudomonadota bacterium]